MYKNIERLFNIILTRVRGKSVLSSSPLTPGSSNETGI
jgi:hypothetical protein